MRNVVRAVATLALLMLAVARDASAQAIAPVAARRPTPAVAAAAPHRLDARAVRGGPRLGRHLEHGAYAGAVLGAAVGMAIPSTSANPHADA